MSRRTPSHWKHRGITLAVVLAVVGAAWVIASSGVDPAVAELQQLRDEAFAQREQMSDDQRRETFGQIRGRMEGLSDQQRRQFFEGSRERMMGFFQERLDAFFALPPDEQQQELDKQIDRIVEWRTSREQARAGQSGAGQGEGRSGWGNRGNRTDAQRDERRKRRLDRSDPKMRAQFSEYRRRMTERMEQRGMEPMRGPRGMFGFGGGGHRSS